MERRTPIDAAACFRQGLAHARRREYDHALVRFTEAIDLDPDCAETYHRRGNALDALGDPA